MCKNLPRKRKMSSPMAGGILPISGGTLSIHLYNNDRSVISTRKSKFDFVGSYLRVLQCNEQADKLETVTSMLIIKRLKARQRWRIGQGEMATTLGSSLNRRRWRMTQFFFTILVFLTLCWVRLHNSCVSNTFVVSLLLINLPCL
jgi:hypothetical protein